MKLVLAEKPSVAQSIAKVLGAAKREDGYLEGKHSLKILHPHWRLSIGTITKSSSSTSLPTASLRSMMNSTSK